MKSKFITKKFIEIAKDLSAEKQINEALHELITIFNSDFHDLKKIRNIKTDQALIPLFDELNKKWNTVRSLIYKHYKQHIIKPNGFTEILKTSYPLAYTYWLNSK